MKFYISTNEAKTIIFSIGRTKTDAIEGAYKLADKIGSVIAENPDGTVLKNESGHSVWHDIPSISIRDDAFALTVLPASDLLVDQLMRHRNIIDWMEHDGRAISKLEAEKLGVWRLDTSRLFLVGPGISGLAYDPETAILMARYMDPYHSPPFVPEDVSAYDDYRRHINNPNVPHNFYPELRFHFQPIGRPKTTCWAGHIVKKLSLVNENNKASLTAEDGENCYQLPLFLGEADLWQLDIIKDETSEFYYVDNGPECWKAMCGRAWVILINKTNAYEYLIAMN